MKQGKRNWYFSLWGLLVLLGLSYSHAWRVGNGKWEQTAELVEAPYLSGGIRVLQHPSEIEGVENSKLTLPAPLESGSSEASAVVAMAAGTSNHLLTGGNAARGEKIFFDKPEAMCAKCHRMKGQGGEVGPDLTRIGAEKSREYLLESLIEPDKVIAAGFTTMLVQTIDGKLVFGVLRETSEQALRIVDVEAKVHLIPVDDIEDQRPGRSAMPADLQKSLSPHEICDLIEFLANQKGS